MTHLPNDHLSPGDSLASDELSQSTLTDTDDLNRFLGQEEYLDSDDLRAFLRAPLTPKKVKNQIGKQITKIVDDDSHPLCDVSSESTLEEISPVILSHTEITELLKESDDVLYEIDFHPGDSDECLAELELPDDSSIHQVSPSLSEYIDLKSVDDADTEDLEVGELLEDDTGKGSSSDLHLFPISIPTKGHSQDISQCHSSPQGQQLLFQKYQSEVNLIGAIPNESVLYEIIELYDQGYIEHTVEQGSFFLSMKKLYELISNRKQSIGFRFDSPEIDTLVIQPQSVIDEAFESLITTDAEIEQAYHEVLKCGRGETPRKIIGAKLKEGFFEEYILISLPAGKIDRMQEDITLKIETILPNDSQNQTVVILDASQSHLQQMDSPSLYKCLKGFSSLMSINLSSSDLGNLDIEKWESLFSALRYVKKINLSHNQLGSISAPHLDSLCESLSNIRVLELTHNELETWSESNLMYFFSKCWNIYKVDLSGNDFSRFSPVFLKDLFAKLTNLRMIRLAHCGLNQSQVDYLFGKSVITKLT